jgi:hypothetical protein
MKYGQIRMLVTQALPEAIAPDLVDLHILGRYTQLLDMLPWPRRAGRAVVQTTAPHETGTVTVTAGSTAVAGSGTGWTSGMNGLTFRAEGSLEGYTFTYVSGTSGTLDRPYEGSTATGAGYQLCQTLYSLPADCRVVHSLQDLVTGVELQPTRGAAWRDLVASTEGDGPLRYRLAPDSATDPPRMRVEVWPVPQTVHGLQVEYSADETGFSGAAPTASLLPWMRPQCLVEGAVADGLMQLAAEHPDRAGVFIPLAQQHERRFEVLRQQMLLTGCLNRGGVPLRMSRRFRLLG